MHTSNSAGSEKLCCAANEVHGRCLISLAKTRLVLKHFKLIKLGHVMWFSLQVEVRPDMIILSLRSELTSAQTAMAELLQEHTKQSASNLPANITNPAHFVLLLVLREQGKDNSI